MSTEEPYPAPALARGVHILEALNRSEQPLTLEQLSQVTDYPKASLLRLLETLTMLSLVQRDEAGKTYSALAGIAYHDRQQFIRDIVRKEMERLTLSTNITSEWYEAGDACMVLVDLYDPPQAEVYISARVGFKRFLNDELEAVTRLALAHGVAESAAPDFWQYDADGERCTLTAANRDHRIQAAYSEGITMDTHWNTNGIRRYAVAVICESELVGILSLGETFTPGANKRIENNLATLAQSAMAIITEIKG